MREPTKITKIRRGMLGELICKGINHAKNASYERRYVWMPFNKIKNKEAPYAPLTKK